MLEKLATGKLRLPLTMEEDEDGLEDPEVVVVTPPPLFDFTGF
jgi:hypothetical protein